MSSKPEQLKPEVAKALQHDIEAMPPVLDTDDEDGPHDSAYVYSQLKQRHTEAVFPTLSRMDKSKGQTVIIVVLVALSVLAAWGTAYEIQTLITPHVQGICASPAVIQNGGCFISQTSIDSQGNSHTTLIPAGVLSK